MLTCCGYIEDVHVNFCRRKNNFWQNYGIFNLDNFQVSLQRRVASLCNQLLPRFASNQFETLCRCYKRNEDMHVNFCRQENHFWQNYGILDLDNFQVRLQYWVASMCNQLLPKFSSNQFETFHVCYEHIEDVHVNLSRQENNFWQNYSILDLDNFQVRLQYWVASLWNQLLPEFTSNQTVHRCYKHIEDVHVTFSGKKIIFWQNYSILVLDDFQIRFQ